MPGAEQSRSSPGHTGLLSGSWWAGLPAGWVVYSVLVEAAALTAAALCHLHVTATNTDLLRFGGLVVLGVVQAELSRRIERDRRRLCGNMHITMTSVWLIAGVLVLPRHLLVLLCAVLYLHMWLRCWRTLDSISTRRTVFGACAALVSCLAASAVAVAAPLAGGPAGFSFYTNMSCVAALVVFELVDAVLLAVSIKLRTRGATPLGELFGTWDDNALEITTLCLGGLTALVLVCQPLFLPLLLCPVLLLHRSVLVKQLETDATTDVKTGLLNAVTWHRLASRELDRVDQVGVLMVDLDHFKRINDTYGHLAGDAVLRSVATAVKAQVRAGDAVGRFGGEEFVVLLPGADERGAIATAERIRATVSALSVPTPVEHISITGLSCSIGVAVLPTTGTSMEQLLLAADTAVYRAKRTGRNRVVASSGHPRAA
ncbi:GGDEF domain-containing protein [Kutzneria albida]|uniref:GGDEF domain-containing diguanylate cyclase n=1 Tax=Kutzneria albida DSM 43870 TaxID=1449976 RepID=W5W6S5_9PSEU|nr:GGDEF domain-containing protein [Kutzneria albida]AHH93909.1 GGDEF domain-containing diguanylate cyclase [Kutzneria albida DSM 43870]